MENLLPKLLNEIEMIAVLTGAFCHRKLDLIVKLEKLKHGKITRTCFYVTPSEYEEAIKEHVALERVFNKNYTYEHKHQELKVYLHSGEFFNLVLGKDPFNYQDYIEQIILLARNKGEV